MTNLCILTGSRAGSNIITNRARALTARRADRRVDARLTTKSISQHPADIRNESSVPELSLDHAARALCYTWRSGPFFGLDNSRVTVKVSGLKEAKRATPPRRLRSHDHQPCSAIYGELAIGGE